MNGTATVKHGKGCGVDGILIFKHRRVVEWMEPPLSNMVRAVGWMEYSFQTWKGSGMEGTATVRAVEWMEYLFQTWKSCGMDKAYCQTW